MSATYMTAVGKRFLTSNSVRSVAFVSLLLSFGTFPSSNLLAEEIRPANRAAAAAFFESMTMCVDWIEAGTPDAFPVENWDAMPAFPNYENDLEEARGLYEAPERARASVFIRRSEMVVVCSGMASWIGEVYGNGLFEAWVANETELGRIQISPMLFGPDENLSLAVCVGETGGLYVRTRTASNWNFAMTARSVRPPEGVCNA